jgi:chromosome partitioning protein
MARKIAVTLKKGGSGKTTTAINLATALALKGKKTLLVDLDPQANATLALGINPLDLELSINNLFTDSSIQTNDVIIKTDYGLYILPSHPDLAVTEAGMQATQVGAMRGLIEPLNGLYDYIIIDTPPSESYLTVNALSAVDDVIIPLQAHFLALQGLAQIHESIDKVKAGLNPDIKIHGILPTMVQDRTNISKVVLDQAKAEYGDKIYPIQIPYSVRHSEATLAGIPIVVYDPAHSGAKAYIKLAERIIRK